MAKWILSLCFVSALAFNLASLSSITHNGLAFTSNDPALSSVFVLLVWLSISWTHPDQGNQASLWHGICCLLGIGSITHAGIMPHIAHREVYATADAYHSTNFIIGIFINLCTVSALVTQLKQNFRVAAMALIAVVVALEMRPESTKNSAPLGCTDVPFFAQDAAAEIPFALLLTQRNSTYITMSDGVDLAVDIYLPRGYTPGESDPLPTFLHLTRYHRNERRRWPFNYFTMFGAPPADTFNLRSLHYIREFVPDGYAFVTVDVRGTGASEGIRPVDLSRREVLDYHEIAQWTHQQPFCNGQIGTGGISYDGITGALMASQGGIKAAALLFSPGDLYEDLVVPGGAPCTGFVDLYGKFTTASERNEPVADVDNELPAAYKLVSSWMLGGVAPVQGQEHKLDPAIAMHKAHNWDMTKEVRRPTIQCKDDTLMTVDGVEHTFNDIGVNRAVFEGLRRHQVGVYNVGGWFDSGSVRSAARLHNFLGPTQSKLTLGPWSHGARACHTPSAESTVSQYPLFADVKRFFDCELKGKCASIPAQEAPVNFFMSGPDEWWKSRDVWPPEGAAWRVFRPAADGRLVRAEDHDGAPQVAEYVVDSNATTGAVSRWNLVQHLMKNAVTYPDRAQQAPKLLTFTTAALPNYNAHTGHPLPIVGSVKLAVGLELLDDGATDAVVFAYLEDVDPATGKVEYITEGVLRAAHRESATDPLEDGAQGRIGAFSEIKRAFTRDQVVPLMKGRAEVLNFMLEPVAYTLREGHQLRLSLGGADADNFLLDNLNGLSTHWKIHMNDTQLQIPVLQIVN